MTLPSDRKKVLIWLYDELKSIRRAAKICRVSKSTAQRWIAERLCVQPIVKKSRKVRRTQKMNLILSTIEASLLADPFKTCAELSRALDVSKELVRQCFIKLGFSYKRARYYGVAKNGLQLARNFLLRRDAYVREGRPMYSVDETGFGRFSYHHRSGWSPRGKELRVVKQNARQTSMSVLACSSPTGWIKTVETNGAFNRAMFVKFISDLEIPAGSVILLDNASIHKGEEVVNIFREKGFVLLYVPPYSPWFNPIEGCFSIVKRKYPACQNIKDSFGALTPHHFKAFFKRSFTSYGVDDENSNQNRAEMEKPSPPVSDNKKKTKIVVRSTTASTNTTVRRQKVDGGVVIVTRTRVVQTTIKRGPSCPLS